MKISKYLSIALSAALFSACITPFAIGEIDTYGGTLVIEGDIILNGTTKVYLSESRALDSGKPFVYITDAQVFILSEHGETYTSTVVAEPYTSPYYLIDTKDFPIDRAYFLSVFLRDGTQFISDPITPLVTPDIDSIEFEVQEPQTAVDFFVTTYATQNSSPYFRWSFTEDWEFTSIYDPNVYYNIGTNGLYPYSSFNKPNIYYCWNQSKSSDILVAKTDHLDNNIVYRQFIHTIDNKSDKISYLYSMELQQMSISEEAYIYWDNMRKNTQEIGGIFSPQPSEVLGNIRAVRVDGKPTPKVLGYISAGTLSTKRIFVDEEELGIHQQTLICDRRAGYSSERFSLYQMGYRPLMASIDEELGISEEWWTPLFCIDCTKRGGTKNKPPFWPNDHR